MFERMYLMHSSSAMSFADCADTIDDGPTSKGQECTLVCASGYTLIGNGEISCRANNTYSSPTGSCEANDCTSNPVPSVGYFEAGTCTGSETTGEGCTLVCASGYTLSGSGVVTCEASGAYSSPTGSCHVNACYITIALMRVYGVCCDAHWSTTVHCWLGLYPHCPPPLPPR